MSDLSKLQKFQDDSYREAYLDAHVKGGIAYQVQALREKSGRNQTEFGELIGKPQSVVSRLESTEYGAVNVNTLVDIANRLKIGLLIRFCDFETLTVADVSPEAFAVENIDETINRLNTLTPPQTISYTGNFQVGVTAAKGSITWQTSQIPNQSPSYQEVETPNFAMFIVMPASQRSGRSM